MENHRFLIPPPVQTLIPFKSIQQSDRDYLGHVIRVLRFVNSQMKPVTDTLTVEEKLLSTLLYKNHHRFRNDKGFKDLKIVLKFLNKFLIDCKLQILYKDLYDLFPLLIDVLERSQEKLYLPSRQTLEFYLVRTHGSFNLLVKLIKLCHNAGDLCFKRLHLGHFWNVALNHLGTISRIWTILKSVIILLAKTYSSLKALLHLDILTPTSVPWLDSNYNFPNDLTDLIDNETNFLKEVVIDAFPIFKPKTNKRKIGVIIHEIDDDDTGTVVQRTKANKVEINIEDEKPPSQKDSELPLELPCSLKKWKLYNEQLSIIKNNKDSLDKFILRETRNRKVDRKTCVTKSLNQDQWKLCKKRLQNIKTDKVDGGSSKDISKIAKNILLIYLCYPQLEGGKPDNWRQIKQSLNNKAKTK